MKSKDAIQKNRIQEITELHNQISSLLLTALEKGIRIGELLTEQKKELPHGQFGQWIEDNLPFAIRTCQEYMKLYENRELLLTQHVQNFRDAKKLLQKKRSDTTQEEESNTRHVAHLKEEEVTLTKAEQGFIASVEACGGSKDKAFRMVLDRRKEKEEKKQKRSNNSTAKKLKYTVMFTTKEHRKIEKKAKKENASIADIIRKFINAIS